MDSGVYKITNVTNNKVYIGSSKELKNRITKHLWLLKNKRHDNIYLQNSYEKYGEKNFKFEVIEYCSEEELIDRENFYILQYKSNTMSLGYNLALVSDNRRNIYVDDVKIRLSKFNLEKNNNIRTFSLTNIQTGKPHIFDSLVEAAKYLISNNFTKGTERNVRMKLSASLRGKKVNNGHNGSFRRTCYKHEFKIIN